MAIPLLLLPDLRPATFEQPLECNLTMLHNGGAHPAASLLMPVHEVE